MKDAMALGILKEEFDCRDLKKCGEITIRNSTGKKETFLNCEFCDYSFLQLEYFIQHVYDEHLCKLMELDIKQESAKSPLRSEEERENVGSGIQSESSFETNDEEQMVLNGFEKVEIELDTNEIHNALHTEEAAPEDILRKESPQRFEANEPATISDETNETDSDSEFDWHIPFVKNKEEERQAKKKFIIEFIEVYRSLPALWNSNLKAYYDNVLKNEQYEILLKKYQEKYPKATLKYVKQKLRSFRSQYRRQVRLIASNGISTLYYYDAMNFLHDIKPRSESHNYSRAHDEAPGDDDASTSNEIGMDNCDSDSDIADDEEDIYISRNKDDRKKKKELNPKRKFVLEFIALFQSLPALWDNKCADYHNRAVKNKQYETLVAKYREKYPDASKDSVQVKIRSMRANFLRVARRRGPKNLYYYDAMTFLLKNYPQSESRNKRQDQEEVEGDDDASTSNEIGMDNCDSDSDIADDEEDIYISRNKDDRKKKKELNPKRKFVLEFIALFQSLPALWDNKCADYHNRAVKNKQYETLVAKYREKYPDASKDSVQVKIRSMRANFLRVARRRGPKNLYYYDAMTFLLKNYPQSESRNKRQDQEEVQVKFGPKLDTSTLQDSLLTDAQFIKLAKIYEKYTCLWDENDIAYRFANRRREARNKLLEEFNNTTKMNLMKNELEKEIARLRKICSNEKKQKIACKRKKVAYKPTCPYYNHIAYLEVDVTPFECSLCGQIISGICQYKIHLSSHDGSLPFKCHICGHGFKLATNLTVHLRRHVQDYIYNCEVCDKPCATTTELKLHSRLHTGEKPYICHFCGKAYASFAELRTHSERSHDKQRRHKCEICSKAFYEKQKLKDHMNAHLEIRDSVCNVCNKGFTSRKILRQHKLIHNFEKKYSCKICGKRFAQSAGLNSHMKSHGVRPFDSGLEFGQE